MSGLFLDAFNMSITAGYFVLAIVLFRFIFRKAPKWVNCMLWAFVAIRLIFPFSFESRFSLVPSTQTIAVDNGSSGLPFSVESGMFLVDQNVNDYLRTHYYEGITVPENTFTDVLSVLAIVWLIGMCLMLIYSAISFIRLKRKVLVSICYCDNIYCCDNIVTPFILGTIRPKIYIPSGLEEWQMENVIMHEKAHLKRKDHWWKPLGFLILSFYWFNPLIWLAYILLCKDIEKACDEKVIKNMNAEEKKGYLETLVDCSVQRKMVLACPVAFGEVGVKQRVKAVLNYKKPALWVIIVVGLVTAIITVGFLTNPGGKMDLDGATSIAEVVNEYKDTSEFLSELIQEARVDIEKLKSKYPHFFELDISDGLTVYATKLSDDNYKWYLSSNKNPTDPQKIMSFSEFADTNEMKTILIMYDIPKSNIDVVPIQHTLSSFGWENMQQETDDLRQSIGLNAKEVWIEIDRDLLDSKIVYDEISFYKDVSEYNAMINLNSREDKYLVIFTESQYHKFMTDKYKQVELYYKGFEESDVDFIFKNVEFDEDFRNLKIYVDESQRQYISSIPEYGIAQMAFSYQMFLSEGVGVNVDVIDYENNEVVWSFTLPEKNN